MQIKILLIIGEEFLQEALFEQFEVHKDFVAICAGNGETGIQTAQKEYFDIILICMALSDMDPCEICILMRQFGVKAPIILLGTSEELIDSDLLMDVGANVQLEKPFRFSVLLGQIREQLRQQNLTKARVLTLGPYIFKPFAKLLVENNTNKIIRLTEKETSILLFLLRVGNKVVGRDTLLNEVWGYNASVTTHTLETHVYRLRQKIEVGPSEAKILLTEPGGYRLIP